MRQIAEFLYWGFEIACLPLNSTNFYHSAHFIPWFTRKDATFYRMLAEEIRCWADFPGDEPPIPMIQIKFPPFSSKSAHPWVNLPAAYCRCDTHVWTLVWKAGRYGRYSRWFARVKWHFLYLYHERGFIRSRLSPFSVPLLLTPRILKSNIRGHTPQDC